MARAHRSTSTATVRPAERPPLAGRRGALTLWLAAAMVAASLPASAAAQQYRSDQPDMRAKGNSGVATLCVRNAGSYTTEKERFAEYFTGYYFPAMTQYGPDDLQALGDFRLNLFRRYLWVSVDETLQKDLTRLAFQAMGNIVVAQNPPYHPAVRYNAVLVLGMLDEQYAIDAGQNRRPPKPHTNANKALTQIVDMATTSNRFPPAVTIGALVGLERHAAYHESLSSDTIEAMASAVLKIINRDEPIQDVDREVHAWMQVQAADVLANLGTVGPNNRNYDALVKLIAGSKSLDDRSHVAGLLRKITFQGATIDGQSAADQLMQLALEVSQDEANEAKNYQESQLGGAGGRGRFGGTATYQRRRLLARLVNLRGGLQAIGPIAPDAVKPKLTAIVSAVDTVIDAADDSDTIDLDIAAKVRVMANAIQGVVGAAAAPSAGEAAS